MNPEQWLSLKWNGGSTMSDRWLNQSKIIQIENDTVKENLLLSKKYRKDFKEKELEESVEKVGISKEYLGHKVCELSGGEQQRIAIARTMLKP